MIIKMKENSKSRAILGLQKIALGIDEEWKAYNPERENFAVLQ
jgi:hypothetical protein